jgi:tRNA nucleotidyltransferase (CCA-adding enzyme)
VITLKTSKLANQVLETLEAHGYEAYFVGGMVRDQLLDLENEDIDITTNAHPEDVMRIFQKVKETGKRYGSVTVFLEEHPFEVTTYREEKEYVDNRHPEKVTFGTSLEEDLKRRDFTINQLVMDKEGKIFDHHKGLEDLDNHLIRTIGDPEVRFEEDALRILRAIRFCAKLGFDIEEKTQNGMQKKKELIQTLAIERVMQELDRIIRGKYRNKAIKYMLDLEIADVLYGLKAGFEKVVTSKEQLYPIEFFIIAFLVGDVEDVFRFSNKERAIIEKAMELHEVTHNDLFNRFIVYVNKLEMCLLVNKINVFLGYPNQENRIREIDERLPIHDVCDLAFKGQDILWETNLKKRSLIGVIIDELIYQVIMEIRPNEYNALKEYALQRVNETLEEMDDNNE